MKFSKTILAMLLIGAGVLAGCKTTTETQQAAWQSASSNFPITFSAESAGGDIAALFQSASQKQSTSSSAGANIYRLNIFSAGRKLSYFYYESHPGYATSLPSDMRATAASLNRGRAHRIVAEGEAPLGPANGKYVIWTTGGRSCLYAVSAFGTVFADNASDFAGNDQLEAVYCAGIGSVTEETAVEIGRGVSISAR